MQFLKIESCDIEGLGLIFGTDILIFEYSLGVEMSSLRAFLKMQVEDFQLQ